MASGSGGPSSGSAGDSGGKLIPQPHGGALSRGGRKPGAKNRPKPLLAPGMAASPRRADGGFVVTFVRTDTPCCTPSSLVA